MKKFTKENVKSISDWNLYNKRVTTKAVRVEGPFETETREGPISTQNGYLAIDSAGWPYPIAKEEFEKIYVKVSSSI